MKYSGFIILILLFLSMQGCVDLNEDVAQEVSLTEGYFPLTIGNSWTYWAKDRSQSLQREIIDTATHNDYLWYKMESNWFWDATNSVHSDTFYVRKDDSQRIYSKSKVNDTGSLWLDLPRKESYTSDKYEEGYIYNITVTHNDTLTTPAGRWTDCISHYFDSYPVADEEEGFTLAPNVGVVRYYGAWINVYLTEFTLAK